MRHFWLIGISLFIISCGGNDKGKASDDRVVFRYNEAAGINKLDPAGSEAFEDVLAMNHIYNGLVQLDDDLEVAPCIAKSWETSDNGKEITFNLRNDVFFHDDECFENGKGRKVVASDFVHSFFRIMDPDAPSQGKSIFYNLKKTEASDFLGVKALNDTTLKLYLVEAQNSFLNQLTLKFCSVVPFEATEKYDVDFRKHPVGTGPFKFLRWVESNKLVLEKNNNYFEKDEAGNKLPYLDAVVITFLPERFQEYQKFVAGNLDMLSGLDPSFQDRLLDGHGELKKEHAETINFVKVPWLKTDYLGFMIDESKHVNVNSPVVNRLVRQAINFAIDREKITQTLRVNIGESKVKGFLPKGTPGYDQLNFEGYKYDIQKARDLLFEAGYRNGQKLNLTLIVANQYRFIAELLQNDLREIGIEVKVESMTVSSHRQQMAAFKANFFRKSWTADYPHPSNFYKLFYSKNFAPENGPNYFHFSNIHYDGMFEQSRVEQNDSIRFSLYSKMEKILVQESPVVPLFYDETVRFYAKNVSGVKSNAMNMLDLRKVKIKH